MVRIVWRLVCFVFPSLYLSFSRSLYSRAALSLWQSVVEYCEWWRGKGTHRSSPADPLGEILVGVLSQHARAAKEQSHKPPCIHRSGQESLWVLPKLPAKDGVPKALRNSETVWSMDALVFIIYLFVLCLASEPLGSSWEVSVTGSLSEAGSTREHSIPCGCEVQAAGELHCRGPMAGSFQGHRGDTEAPLHQWEEPQSKWVDWYVLCDGGDIFFLKHDRSTISRLWVKELGHMCAGLCWKLRMIIVYPH